MRTKNIEMRVIKCEFKLIIEKRERDIDDTCYNCEHTTIIFLLIPFFNKNKIWNYFYVMG